MKSKQKALSIIDKMFQDIMEHQKENGFETVFDFLDEDLDELKALVTEEVAKHTFEIGSTVAISDPENIDGRHDGQVYEVISILGKYVTIDFKGIIKQVDSTKVLIMPFPICNA